MNLISFLLNRYFVNEMKSNDPFYIVDVSYYLKEYMKWMNHFPEMKPFYSVKVSDSDLIIK